jgi:hypothetical protein
MLLWALFGTMLLLLPLPWLMHYRSRRRRLYLGLAHSRDSLLAGQQPGLTLPPNPATLAGLFHRERFLRVEGVLDSSSLERRRKEALAVREQAERSYIPGHKQGGTLSYEQIHRHAPGCLWHDPRVPLLKEWARRIKDTAFFGLRALWD